MPPKRPIPPDQEARDRIVRDLDRCLLVEAAAGTGKTTSMVGRMVALLAEGKCEISEIAAITFTKKAAAELRDRFQVALFQAVRETEGERERRLFEAAEHVDRGFVGTIHSFCARLLRERPVEAGVDVSFQELDDAEDERLRKKAWDDHVAALFAEEDPILENLRRLGLSIVQLKGSFLRLADYPDVSEWPAPPVDPPDLKPIVRDLRNYANRMTEVSAQFVDPTVSDELAEEYKLVPKLIHVLDLQNPVDVMRLAHRFTKKRILGQARWEQLTGGFFDKKRAKEEGQFYEEFSAAKAEPALRQWREHLYPTAFAAIRTAVSRYDHLRRVAGRLNYQDLLMKAATLLRDHPQVRRYFARRFTHLLVDEFQDTDPIQAEAMLLLTADDPDEKDWIQCKPVPGSLFVVGDPKQSIYRFRRADIVTYNQVKEIVQGSGGEVVTLSTNFRTLEPITTWVNDLFEEPFNAASAKHSPRYVSFQPGRSAGDLGVWPSISKIVVAGEGRSHGPLLEADSDRIARTIRHAIDMRTPIPRTPSEHERGMSSAAQPGDFMILARTKKHLFLYARKLQEYGIPHLVSGGGGASETEEVLLLKNCVAVIARPDNPVALVALLRGPLFGFDDETLFRFRDAGGLFDYRDKIPKTVEAELADRFQTVFKRLESYKRCFDRLPPISAIECISDTLSQEDRTLDGLGLTVRSLSGGEGNLMAGSFLKTIEYLRANRSSIQTLSDLVDVLDNLLGGEEELDGTPARPDPSSVVRVMNLHKAKGLEAPVVFLADPTGGRERKPEIHIDRAPEGARGFLLIQEEREFPIPPFPIAEPKDWGAWCEEEKRFLDAEEKRLLYVAATRAGAHLVVSQKAGKTDTGSWFFFAEGLQDCPELPDPGSLAPPSTESEPLTREAFDSFHNENRKEWDRIVKISYGLEAAKQIDSGLLPHHPTQTDRGMDWGTLIHALLETAMKDPSADLRALAKATIEEMGVDPGWDQEALEVVSKVQSSEVWGRAVASQKRFVEIPFQTLKEGVNDLGDSIPILLRGVIDLAFREERGWVLVDYKTDRVSETGVDELRDKYMRQIENYDDAWKRIAGEPFCEKFIYLTYLERLVPMNPPL